MLIDTRKIEIIMAKQELSQVELAKKCGMPRQNLSALLRHGRVQPKTVGKLVKGLGVQVEDLLLESK